MDGQIKTLLEMSQWFKSHGESELAEECRRTATKMLDFIMWRRDERNLVQPGGCTPKENMV